LLKLLTTFCLHYIVYCKQPNIILPLCTTQALQEVFPMEKKWRSIEKPLKPGYNSLILIRLQVITPAPIERRGWGITKIWIRRLYPPSLKAYIIRNYVPIRIKDSIEGVRDSNPLMLSNVALSPDTSRFHRYTQHYCLLSLYYSTLLRSWVSFSLNDS